MSTLKYHYNKRYDKRSAYWSSSKTVCGYGCSKAMLKTNIDEFMSLPERDSCAFCRNYIKRNLDYNEDTQRLENVETFEVTIGKKKYRITDSGKVFSAKKDVFGNTYFVAAHLSDEEKMQAYVGLVKQAGICSASRARKKETQKETVKRVTTKKKTAARKKTTKKK